MTNSDLRLLNGDKIPYSAAESPLRHLCGTYHNGLGCNTDIVDQLAFTLERCRGAQQNPTKNYP